MKIKLSNSHAVFGQGLIVFFFTPFNTLLWIVVIRTNVNSSSLLFASIVTAFSLFIIYLAFKTSDILIENHAFIIRKLFWKTKRFSREFTKIDGFMFGYCLEFENQERVYVLFGPDELIEQITSSKSSPVVDKIQLLINQELYNEAKS